MISYLYVNVNLNYYNSITRQVIELFSIATPVRYFNS